MSAAKITVAKKAIGHIEKKLDRNMVLGIGTGSTVNFFIEELNGRIDSKNKLWLIPK